MSGSNEVECFRCGKPIKDPGEPGIIGTGGKHYECHICAECQQMSLDDHDGFWGPIREKLEREAKK